MKGIVGNYPDVIYVRMSRPVREWLDDRASQAGVPMSTYARHVLEREANRDLQRSEVADGGVRVIADE
jgi:hypothetical protein